MLLIYTDVSCRKPDLWHIAYDDILIILNYCDREMSEAPTNRRVKDDRSKVDIKYATKQRNAFSEKL